MLQKQKQAKIKVYQSQECVSMSNQVMKRAAQINSKMIKNSGNRNQKTGPRQPTQAIRKQAVKKDPSHQSIDQMINIVKRETSNESKRLSRHDDKAAG